MSIAMRMNTGQLLIILNMTGKKYFIMSFICIFYLVARLSIFSYVYWVFAFLVSSTATVLLFYGIELIIKFISKQLMF